MTGPKPGEETAEADGRQLTRLSLVGAFFAELANFVWPAVGLSPALMAIVGMAAFFTAVVRAPFTGALLVLGMTGTIEPLLPVLAASIAATIVPTALGSAPIYDTLRERMEQRLPPKAGS